MLPRSMRPTLNQTKLCSAVLGLSETYPKCQILASGTICLPHKVKLTMNTQSNVQFYVLQELRTLTKGTNSDVGASSVINDVTSCVLL